MATILVVDDSPIDRRLLQGILEKQGGYIVETVPGGMEALAARIEKPPGGLGPARLFVVRISLR